MTTALTFNDVTLSPIQHQGSLWIRATELARALGYSDESKVSRIYRAHSDEFTPDMVQTLEIAPEAQNGLPGKMRIFSPRGCHLIAMFARTAVAKQFRRWVLDVLDKFAKAEHQPEALTADAPITPDQQCTLQAIVRAKIEALPGDRRRNRALFPKAWGMFNNHFRVARYCQLPQCRMSEAVAYLMQMDLTPPALPPAPEPRQLPVPVEGDKALQRLHSTREFCRFDFLPRAYRANDQTAARRFKLAEDLYKLQDCLWAALYNVCSAAQRIRDEA